MVLRNNCTDLLDFIMLVNCYIGRFVITAKSLETNVAVVTRVDCIVLNVTDYVHCIWKVTE
jgi:hypothetical protein